MDSSRPAPRTPHGRHDGRPHCLLCSRSLPDPGTSWCPVADALLCPSCCDRVADAEPGPLIGALEHRTEASVTPEEVAALCAACSSRARQEGRAEATEESLPS